MNKHREINLPHNATESQLHASVAELLAWILVPPTTFTTFPAGWGKLSKATAGRLYAAGMKKGMPDILVFAQVDPPHPRRTKVIGIELKAGANSVTSAQRTMFAQLQSVGIKVYVCRSQNDVISSLADAGISYRNVHIPAGKTQVEPNYGAAGGIGHVLGARS